MTAPKPRARQKSCKSCKQAAAELEKRRHIGAQMANVLFNLAQSTTLPARARATMDGVRREWDAIERWRLPALSGRRKASKP